MTKQRYEQIIRLQRVIVGECDHTVKVTRIGKAWHIRVFLNGEINQEAKCFSRLDIGYTCRSMLRMEDKCGNISDLADSARDRLKRKPQG